MSRIIGRQAQGQDPRRPQLVTIECNAPRRSRVGANPHALSWWYPNPRPARAPTPPWPRTALCAPAAPGGGCAARAADCTARSCACAWPASRRSALSWSSTSRKAVSTWPRWAASAPSSRARAPSSWAARWPPSKSGSDSSMPMPHERADHLNRSPSSGDAKPALPVSASAGNHAPCATPTRACAASTAAWAADTSGLRARTVLGTPGGITGSAASTAAGGSEKPVATSPTSTANACRSCAC